MMKRLEKYAKIFVLLISTFIILQLIHVLFFKSASGDIFFIDYAKNILKGRLAVSAYSDLFSFNKYFLACPFLNSFLISLAFRMFGISYNVAAIVPLIFALLNILLVYFYCANYIGRLEALITSSILMFDPMFFSYASVARPEMVVLFFFTFSALLYFRAEKDHNLVKIYLSGILGGLAMLSSINAFWLLIILAVYRIWGRDLLRTWRVSLAYISGCLTISLPYYGWILFNRERFDIFMMQLFINSSYREVAKLGWLRFLIKSILNPLADLYVIFVRHHSFFPFILGFVILSLIFMQKRFRYFLCVLLIPLFMMTINIRAGHYLLIIMPVGMVGLAYVMKHIRKPILSGILVAIILVSMPIDLSATFRKPDLKVDVVYFREILEENTEDNSRIVADQVFALAEAGKRKIFNISPLIFFPYRIVYSFDEIVSRLDMGYIILTERKYKWVMSDDRQNDEFKHFLKKEFSLMKFIDNREHGKLWIYVRKSKRK